MNNVPFISVVVPAYNEQDYLDISLSSLANQDYPTNQYEVIVVDNASTDRTNQIAKEWDVRVIEEPDKGVARARQTGFMAARGHVIASTDADTAVSPDWLSRIAQAFEANPELGGVFGPVYWPDGQPLERWMIRYPVTWGLYASNRLGHALWWGSNFAVRREVFLVVGGFSTHMGSGEDTDLSLRVHRHFTVHYDSDLVVFSSPRRMKAGRMRYAYAAMKHATRRFVLHSTLPPMSDFR